MMERKQIKLHYNGISQLEKVTDEFRNEDSTHFTRKRKIYSSKVEYVQFDWKMMMILKN